MPHKVWQVELEDGTHTVELDHGMITGKRVITVDGKTVAKKVDWKAIIIDMGSQHQFSIGNHTLLLRIGGRTTPYELFVDGLSTYTEPPRLPLRPIPAWAWVFVLLNLGIIPFTAFIPISFLLAAFGAVLSVVISRSPQKTTRERVLTSLALTFVLYLSTVIIAAMMLTFGRIP